MWLAKCLRLLILLLKIRSDHFKGLFTQKRRTCCLFPHPHAVKYVLWIQSMKPCSLVIHKMHLQHFDSEENKHREGKLIFGSRHQR